MTCFDCKSHQCPRDVRKQSGARTHVPPASQMPAYQALCPLLSVSRAAGDRTQSAQFPTLSHPPSPTHSTRGDISLPPPPILQPVPFPVLICPPSPQAQISVPKGPVSGHVPSPLEAHPCIWLLPTEEGADTIRETYDPSRTLTPQGDSSVMVQPTTNVPPWALLEDLRDSSTPAP